MKPILLSVPFPLTPALSPKEREQQGPPLEYPHAAGCVDRLATILPLPEGEGRGEGKTDARNPADARNVIRGRRQSQPHPKFGRPSAAPGLPPSSGKVSGMHTGSFVPEGQPRIARRFNAGEARKEILVPEGRLRTLLALSRPFGTDSRFRCAHPALKRRAILGGPFGAKRRIELTDTFSRTQRATPSSRGRVAQVSNLLYRRLLVGSLHLLDRACGLEIRDTAGWKPALRLPVSDTREISGLRAACCADAATSRPIPLLTELEKGSIGWRFYKHGAPNGACPDGGNCTTPCPMTARLRIPEGCQTVAPQPPKGDGRRRVTWLFAGRKAVFGGSRKQLRLNWLRCCYSGAGGRGAAATPGRQRRWSCTPKRVPDTNAGDWRQAPSGIPSGCERLWSLDRGSHYASTPGYRLSSLRRCEKIGLDSN